MVKVFSAKGKEVAATLRDAKKVLQVTRSFDKHCYLVIEDIRWRQNALL